MEGLAMSFDQGSGFFFVTIGSMFVGLLMNVIGLNPIRALVYAALLNGLAAPPLILLMLLLGNNKHAVHRYRSGWLSNTLVGLACLLMKVIPLASLFII